MDQFGAPHPEIIIHFGRSESDQFLDWIHQELLMQTSAAMYLNQQLWLQKFCQNRN